ncbi:MAG: SUMF1/EgtB/PvdO family nonheme iron enzyme [Bacteroidales bacterium]|nr:SUMF1/EgtB/PvdO family nonheme iron enzyme [Bacteroidales bacterium]
MFLLLTASCKKDDDPDPDKPPVVVDVFDLSLTTIHFTAEKDASLVVVKTNGDWKATCDAGWIVLSAYEGNKSTGFIIGASANQYFPREAIITITSEEKIKEIKVNQAGVASISFEINGVSFSLLPVIADTSFYLDGDTYLASRSVYLDSYFISETEITNAQWKAVTGTLPYGDENSMPDLPVVANWNNITENFIPRINEQTAYRFRLPTENEWEVAARGGLESGNTGYAGSIYIDEVAWYAQNSEGRKHLVALKKPNELGLYDMSGNVSEWCSDWYGEWTEDNRPPAESSNPTGPATGTEKVIRGGDFLADRFEYDRNSCRVTSRNHLPPDINTEDFLYEGYNHFTGFRLVIAKK